MEVLQANPWAWGLLVVSVGLAVMTVRLKRQRDAAQDKLPGLARLEEEADALQAQNQRLQAEMVDLQVMKGEANQQREQVAQLRQDLGVQQAQYEQLQQRYAHAQSELSGLKNRMEAERESHAESWRYWKRQANADAGIQGVVE